MKSTWNYSPLWEKSLRQVHVDPCRKKKWLLKINMLLLFMEWKMLKIQNTSLFLLIQNFLTILITWNKTIKAWFTFEIWALSFLTTGTMWIWYLCLTILTLLCRVANHRLITLASNDTASWAWKFREFSSSNSTN